MIGFECCLLFLFLLSSFFSFHLLFSSLLLSSLVFSPLLFSSLLSSLLSVAVVVWCGVLWCVFGVRGVLCDTLNRPLCVHSKRLRVYRQKATGIKHVDVVPVDTGTF